MSLNKSIQSGKEHRKEYRGTKAIDKTCRNHGGYAHCAENRQYKNRKRQDSVNQQLRESKGKGN